MRPRLILLWQIVLTMTDGKKYSFSFREDTHCWYLLINEMWSGRVISEEKNDPLIRDLAIQNVLIVDAFLRRFQVFCFALVQKLSVKCTAVVNFSYKNPRWWTAAVLKIEKSEYLMIMQSVSQTHQLSTNFFKLNF